MISISNTVPNFCILFLYAIVLTVFVTIPNPFFPLPLLSFLRVLNYVLLISAYINIIETE